LKEWPPGLDAGQSLALTLATKGDIYPKVGSGGQQVSFQDREGRVRLTCGELAVVDARGSRAPARLEVAGSRVKIVVDDQQAVYPLTIDPLVQQAYLKASNTDDWNWFGNSVAISGDTVVVGAHFEGSNAKGVDGNQLDHSAYHAGAAYVFNSPKIYLPVILK
jgi:trimeric autotransporter adhesin